MRTRIFLALFLSLILIGAASWTRFGRAEPKQGTLAVVERGGQLALNDDLEGNPLGGAQPIENLSNTDLISRQLISDYISLSASGQATPQNIEALASKYVDAIPALAVAEQFTYGELKTVTNTRANLTNYADAITKIYSDYAQSLLRVQAGRDLATAFSSGSGEVPRKMRDIYRETAYKLKALPVPSALVESHFLLANLYLENASAMNSLSQTQADPAPAFAGLIMMGENINQEAELLIKIEQTLRANGI